MRRVLGFSCAAALLAAVALTQWNANGQGKAVALPTAVDIQRINNRPLFGTAKQGVLPVQVVNGLPQGSSNIGMVTVDGTVTVAPAQPNRVFLIPRTGDWSDPVDLGNPKTITLCTSGVTGVEISIRGDIWWDPQFGLGDRCGVVVPVRFIRIRAPAPGLGAQIYVTY